MPGLNLSRDPARTPMQWDDTEYAGFSTVKPWLPVSPTYRRINVAMQKRDTFSMLNLYKRLIDLRRKEPALHRGDFLAVFSDRQVIAYMRRSEDQRFLIVLNLSHRPYYFHPESFKFRGTVELSTEYERAGEEVENGLTMSGDEGLLIRLIPENSQQA